MMFLRVFGIMRVDFILLFLLWLLLLFVYDFFVMVFNKIFGLFFLDFCFLLILSVRFNVVSVFYLLSVLVCLRFFCEN